MFKPTVMHLSLQTIQLALFGILLIPASAGILRYYVGLTFDTSILIGAVSALFFALFMAQVFLRPGKTLESMKDDEANFAPIWMTLLGLAFANIFLYLRLSAPSFAHLPIIGTEGGGDSGNHVLFAESFRFRTPREYEGQNLFYVLLGIFKNEQSRDFHSAFWHSTLALWWLSFSFIALIWYSIVNKSKDVSKVLITGGLGLAIALAFSDRLILPYFHYFQIDGFYSSIAGFAVLSGGIAAYSIFQNAILRLLILLVCAVCLRHAYALNVGEFLATCSLVFCLESFTNGFSKAKARTLRLFSALLFVAAIIVYKSLYPLLSIGGGFTKWRAHNALPLEFCFLAICLLEYWTVRKSTQAPDQAYRRFLTFAGLFVGVGLLVQLSIYAFKLPQMYYFYKHAMPMFLVAGVGLIAIVLRRLSLLSFVSKSERQNMTSRLTTIVLIVGFFAAWTTSRIYNVTYDVRRQDCSSGCFELSPLHFPEIQREIETVLEAKQKKFGGILHTHWPFFNFLTASLGRHVALWNEQPTYFSGSLAREEGYCVFWSETQREKERMLAFTRDTTFTEEKKNRLAIYNYLVSSPLKECGQETGSGYWRNTLCWECR